MRRENKQAGKMTVFLCLFLLLACYAKGLGAGETGTLTDTKASPCIALTFDDGPSPQCTQQLLDGLLERQVKATFFVVGKYAEAYPELVQRMVEEGHVVGNHTYSHVQLSACTYEEARTEIERNNEVLFRLTGERPVYIRPPYGCYTEKLEAELPMEKVMWTIDPEDWKVQNTQAVVSHVLQYARDGGIILLHDPFPTSVEAAFQIIDRLKEQGYLFVTVEDLSREYEISGMEEH